MLVFFAKSHGVSCGPVNQSREFDETKTVSIWGLMTHTDSRKTADGCHHQYQEVKNVPKLVSAFLHNYAGAVPVCCPTDTSIFQSSPVQLLYHYQQSPQNCLQSRAAGWSGYLAALKLSLSDKQHTFCSRKGLALIWNSKTSRVVNKSQVRSNEYIQRETSQCQADMRV